MQFLSQATVPIFSTLRAGLVDGYAWHQALWKSFPGRPEASRDFMFRTDRRGDAMRVLLLSEMRPQSANMLAWDTKDIGHAFLHQDVYRFQLKANPTFRRSSDRRRLAIFDEENLRNWLNRKAQASGFSIDADTLSVGAPISETCAKLGKRGRHVAVDFEGLLRVNDRDAFIAAFHTGIGSAKGFGYGLLMLQPVPKP